MLTTVTLTESAVADVTLAAAVTDVIGGTVVTLTTVAAVADVADRCSVTTF